MPDAMAHFPFRIGEEAHLGRHGGPEELAVRLREDFEPRRPGSRSKHLREYLPVFHVNGNFQAVGDAVPPLIARQNFRCDLRRQLAWLGLFGRALNHNRFEICRRFGRNPRQRRTIAQGADDKGRRHIAVHAELEFQSCLRLEEIDLRLGIERNPSLVRAFHEQPAAFPQKASTSPTGLA